MFVRRKTINRLKADLDHAFSHIKRLDEELFTEVHPARNGMWGYKPAQPTTAGTINAILEFLDLKVKTKPARSARTYAVDKIAEKEAKNEE